jgi:predicted amidohydrolase YtcJ
MEFTSSLIRTKLNIPRINGDLVERPRLLDKLNQRLNRKVILITAPAGFDKTSLVVSGVSRITTEPAPYADSITINDQQPAIFRAGKVGCGEGSVKLCFPARNLKAFKFMHVMRTKRYPVDRPSSFTKRWPTARILIISLCLALLAAIPVAACGRADSVDVSVTIEAVPEVVFFDGTILTMADEQPRASAILIRGENIVVVGETGNVLAQASPDATLVDLEGRTVLPGFIDSHSHRFGWTFTGVGYESPETAIQVALEQGWTGLHELDVNGDLAETLRRLDEQGQLRLRVAGYLGTNSPIWEEAIGAQLGAYEPTIYSPYLRITGVKIFMKPDSEFYLDEETLTQRLPQLHKDGWQIAIESVNSQTQEMVLNAFELALEGDDNSVSRHRIEHVVAITDEQVTRMAHMGIIASIQLNVPASLLSADYRDALHRLVQEEPVGTVARWRDLVEAGVPVIGNTDFPSIDMEIIDRPAPGSPIRLLYRGVTRTWADKRSPEAWMLDQTITAEQALRLMTINAANASLEEDSRGSLAPGKLADLVILSANPLVIPTEELTEIEVLMTMVGGKVEWCQIAYESLCPGNINLD